MASVIPKFVTLKLSNVAPKSSDKTVTVQSVSVRPQYDKGTHKPIPDSIDGYNLTFYALRSGSQTVKLPKDVEPQIKKIKEALDHDAFVSVSFGTPSTFRARFTLWNQAVELFRESPPTQKNSKSFRSNNLT